MPGRASFDGAGRPPQAGSGARFRPAVFASQDFFFWSFSFVATKEKDGHQNRADIKTEQRKSAHASLSCLAPFFHVLSMYRFDPSSPVAMTNITTMRAPRPEFRVRA
jgi:hypothetical protein